ncbi:uncharacterized protein CIMG_10145 [Coccidioides immitis RS]|uniref:Uncharacterized protein n=7 Tax=Coccidioides TaxID=5500 RepID=J3K0X0_COCIM|nr:uncharacterized protein CIMG_10145 [Coccidioides immitis RS]XP_003072083.1 hypothetical protein CPC735_012560 [Coccidioides posadasii C735 delta SOWgp]EFW19015.1 conserved hypothetical protein [Coccidioides posadasii str. Silveira]KMM71363.1 hypothetical protein CPAG_07670 [Coccidioides posadasii RMSCC 3488]KMP09497.1 hypothetical protein CIRG_09667 [Coccidioides immitis RMSCC 2394]KMU78493.1 hypothetical protein CISG_07497 [Coccidioides immitis RMSCC 3703]KMU92541.1 hypothetical protein C|eukprot:XP_003072083.1 hypothetical protein CPC735_012560 [Coccidioides posadasii C735 delta SOWgp]
MGAIVSIFHAIGDCLMTIVQGIGSILTAIIGGVVSIFSAIISCLTCGWYSRRRTRSTGGVGRRHRWGRRPMRTV